jgi:uncharacterized protein (DUF58 family)
VRNLFPLTLRGTGLALSATAGLTLLGYRAMDQVWYVAGLGMLALVALSVLLVGAATLRVQLALRRMSVAQPLEPKNVDTRTSIASGFVLPSLRFWPLVELELEISAPPDLKAELRTRHAWLEEELSPRDHGELRAVTRAVAIRDVFGLSRMTLEREGRVSLDVLPHAGALRSLPLLRSLAGGDDIPHPMGIAQGDRLDLRRYAPGDPARFIHWKAFARTRRLVVRVPERALSRAHRVAAYLVAGDDDGASAAVARVALEEGGFGDDFRFGADGTAAPCTRVADSLSAIRRSAAARREPAAGLSAFLRAVEKEGPVSLVLFVPAQHARALAAIRDVVMKRSRPPRIVIGIDGLISNVQEPLWKRAAFVARAESRISAISLRRALADYRAMGAEVLVLDRESGRALSEAHFARLSQGEAA